jgi:hypothetical protein
MQKILEKSAHEIYDALDFQQLADDMQGYIHGIATTVDRELSKSLQATLDDFKKNFSALTYGTDGGKKGIGYADAVQQALDQKVKAARREVKKPELLELV